MRSEIAPEMHWLAESPALDIAQAKMAFRGRARHAEREPDNYDCFSRLPAHFRARGRRARLESLLIYRVSLSLSTPSRIFGCISIYTCPGGIWVCDTCFFFSARSVLQRWGRYGGLLLGGEKLHRGNCLILTDASLPQGDFGPTWLLCVWFCSFLEREAFFMSYGVYQQSWLVSCVLNKRV